MVERKEQVPLTPEARAQELIKSATETITHLQAQEDEAILTQSSYYEAGYGKGSTGSMEAIETHNALGAHINRIIRISNDMQLIQSVALYIQTGKLDGEWRPEKANDRVQESLVGLNLTGILKP